MTNSRNLSLAALVACSALFIAPIHAQETPKNIETTTVTTQNADHSNKKDRKNLPDRSDWISLKQAFEAVEKAGYKDLHGIHLSRDGYIAKAKDENQNRVLLKVDPKTSTVSVHEGKRPYKHSRKHNHHHSTKAAE